MHMRPSRVLKRLRSGKTASCVKINFSDPRTTEIAAMCGFDCIWLDMEHVPTDFNTIENQIRSAKLYDVDTIVRVPRGSYSDYIRPLEADAAGIMVPHVMSRKDAEKIVWQTKFHPIGRRAVDGGNQDGAYCMIDFNEYIKTANEQRFVIAQIEDPEPLDELEEIAKLDGIDMLFFGPADFSQGIGKPGQFDAPEISEARKRISDVAKKYNKFAGTVGTVDNFKKLSHMGYQFINIAADVIGLSEYFRKIVADINEG